MKQKNCSILVKVGSLPHPMEQEHSILWIEVINGDYVNRKYLHPGGVPEAEFLCRKPSWINSQSLL